MDNGLMERDDEQQQQDEEQAYQRCLELYMKAVYNIPFEGKALADLKYFLGLNKEPPK